MAHARIYDEAGIIIEANEDHQCETILYCKIFYAEGIDQPRPRNSEAMRHYRVYGSVNPENNERAHGVRSTYVQGDPNPCWNAWFSLPLGEFNPADNISRYLYLELVKLDIGSEEPQPSNKELVVARTRIRLPNRISQETTGSYELVKLLLEDGSGIKPAGRILVTMVLKQERW